MSSSLRVLLLLAITIVVNVGLELFFATFIDCDNQQQQTSFLESWRVDWSLLAAVTTSSDLYPSGNNHDGSFRPRRNVICPEIPIGSCSSWSFTTPPNGGKITWVWNNSCLPNHHHDNQSSSSQLFRVPRTALGRRPFDDVTHNRTTVVMYGSSHVRGLYLALIRLHRGLDLMSRLERNATYVMNGMWSPKCDPERSGFLNGSYGVDLVACKEPTKRIALELGHKNVAIGFKTFLHTPDADNLMIQFLERQRHPRLRHPQVLITDIGVWGARGARMAGSANTTMTKEQELDYNIDWLRSTFPRSQILLILENETTYERVGLEGLARRKILQFAENNPSVTLLRKDMVMKEMNPKMRCDHGCAGPVMVVVAHLVLDWLKAATRKCLNPQRRFRARTV